MSGDTVLVGGVVRMESLDQAEALRAKLKEKVLDIETQLSRTSRTHPDGTPLTGYEYTDWRRSAITAMTITRKQLIQVKAYIAEEKKKRWERRTKERDANGHRTNAQRLDDIESALTSLVEAVDGLRLEIQRGGKR